MPYGKLSCAQADILRRHLGGRVVHDLGAGNLGLTRRLLDLGALSVVAVDKERLPRLRDPRIRCVSTTFEKCLDTPDVAFVSWPSNRPLPGLVPLLHRAQLVIYLGKNTDGSACGHWTLFSSLLHREVLAYLPERENTMIVYGDPGKTVREPLGEEMAALTMDECMWGFEEAEGLTRVGGATPMQGGGRGRRRSG